MKIYCLCGHNQFVPLRTLPCGVYTEIASGNVAPDRNGENCVLSLCIPMISFKVNVQQVILGDGNNRTKLQESNVNILECSNCSRQIAIEREK